MNLTADFIGFFINGNMMSTFGSNSGCFQSCNTGSDDCNIFYLFCRFYKYCAFVTIFGI